MPSTKSRAVANWAGESAVRPAVAEALENRCLLTAGDRDLSFGYRGTASTNVTNGDDAIHAMAVQPDGKIVVVGAGSHAGAARYRPDGSPDDSFAGGLVELRNMLTADAMIMLANGDILVGGSGFTSADGVHGVVAHVRYNGSIDRTFATTGRAVVSIGLNDFITTMASSPDGRFFVGGRTFSKDTGAWDAFVAHLNADGTLDDSFGRAGVVVVVDFGGAGEEGVNAMVVQPDGKIVVAGFTTRSDGAPGLALARCQSDGSLDASFGEGGVSTPVPPALDGGERINALLRLPDGGLIGGGSGGRKAATLFRFDSDGKIDADYYVNGRLTVYATASDSVINSLTRRADGKIYAAGSAFVDGDWNFLLIRYNADAVPDRSFSSDGVVVSDLGGATQSANALALTADNKIIVAGGIRHGVDRDFVAARYFDDVPFIAPDVESVVVHGVDWSQSFIDRLHADSPGDDGYALPTTSQNPPLPWTNLNQIKIRFSQNVVVDRDDLKLSGRVAPVSAFNYDPTTRTASWTLSAPLAAGQFHIGLSSVFGTSGTPLSTENATRSWLVLPADVDRSGGSVNASDLVKVRNRIGRSVQQPGTGTSAYAVFVDLNGDGNITASDLVLVRNRIGSALPAAARATLRSPFASSAFIRSEPMSATTLLREKGLL